MLIVRTGHKLVTPPENIWFSPVPLLTGRATGMQLLNTVLTYNTRRAPISYYLLFPCVYDPVTLACRNRCLFHERRGAALFASSTLICVYIG